MYCRNIARIPDLAALISKGECKLIGDEDGNPGPVTYKTFTFRKTSNGGPVMWVNFRERCADCRWKKKAKKPFCQNVPENKQCHPEGVKANLNKGQDEIAMNCEIGLYLDFKVSETGIPYGCEGLTAFNNTMWKKNSYHAWSRLPNKPDAKTL